VCVLCVDMIHIINVLYYAYAQHKEISCPNRLWWGCWITAENLLSWTCSTQEVLRTRNPLWTGTWCDASPWKHRRNMAERLKCAAITIFLTQVWAFYWGIWWIYICGYSCPRFKIVEVPGTGIPVPRIWGQIKTSGFGDLPGLEVPFHAHYSRVDQITNTRTQSVHIASWLGVANIYELRVFITMILFLTLQSIISVLSSFHVFALICVTLL